VPASQSENTAVVADLQLAERIVFVVVSVVFFFFSFSLSLTFSFYTKTVVALVCAANQLCLCAAVRYIIYNSTYIYITILRDTRRPKTRERDTSCARLERRRRSAMITLLVIIIMCVCAVQPCLRWTCMERRIISRGRTLSSRRCRCARENPKSAPSKNRGIRTGPYAPSWPHQGMSPVSSIRRWQCTPIFDIMHNIHV